MHILCDIDGTVADITHRLHYIRTEGQKKNWPAFFEACDEDKPISNVIHTINTLYDGGYSIIFVSGRSEVVRDKTEHWLYEKVGFDTSATAPLEHDHAELHMRKKGDYRPDYIVKEEMMSQQRWTPENTLCVFDDRNQIVQMWRRHGFTVFQCADGDF